MSTARDRKRAKARQKKKAKDATRRKASNARRAQKSKRVSASAASHWPLGEAYVSEHWHEWGAHVHAVFTRVHGDGRVAAAVLEVDLEEEGLLNAEYNVYPNDAWVQQLLMERSQGDHAMMYADPGLVAKIGRTGHKLGSDGAKGWSDVEDLFADTPDSSFDIHTGNAIEDSVTEEVPKPSGLVDRIKGIFGLG